MRIKATKKREREDDDLDIWGLIRQKLAEKSKTVEWLSEQVPQGKKTFNWFYSRDRINTDMLWDVSEILGYNFFKDCSEHVQRVLAEMKKAETE